MADGITFFRSGSGGGGVTGDYVKNSFDDYTLLASTNTGLTSTTATNPLSDFFQNDDLPKYQTKTLFVKDLVLLDDRSKWINNRPTYRVVWNEDFVGVSGYVCGDIRLRNLPNGKAVDIRDIGDFFGITGVVRTVAWIVNPTVTATGTALYVTDGVSTGVSASFGNSVSDSAGTGYNHYSAFVHSGGLATKDIHDFRLQANEYTTLNVLGVVVYYENSGKTIDLFPGSTYLDKDNKTTTVGSTFAIPSVVSRLGGKSVISKTTSSSYAITTVETPEIQTIGQGSTGTNLVTVTTGQGASFPVGMGVMGIWGGATFYIGTITNQSTDTLTVSPTLSFGLSGPLSKVWAAGPTFPIGATLYRVFKTLDMQELNVVSDNNGFVKNQSGNYYYSTPDQAVRLWGKNLIPGMGEGYPGVHFFGGTAGFLQVDGRFCAAELEISGIGTYHATFAINGVLAWGMNEGVTGVIRKTVFSDA